MKLFKKFKGLFPQELPVGTQAFNDFCDEVLATYDLPNNPGHKHNIATQILQAPADRNKKSPKSFAVAVLKQMANDSAYAAMQEINAAMKAKAKEEKDLADATTHTGSDELSQVGSV